MRPVTLCVPLLSPLAVEVLAMRNKVYRYISYLGHIHGGFDR
jgi:hypothetical protein